MPHNRNLLGCQRFHAQLLPSGWDCAPLSERIEFEYGFGLTEEIRRPGPYKVFGSNGVVGLHDEARVAGPGIIVGRKGTVGATTFTDSPFWPIDTVYYVTKKKQDDWRYLCVLLKFLDLGRLNAATGVPGLSRRDALAIRGAFPPLEEQRSIVAVLDAADTAIERANEALRQMWKLRQALLQNLFRRGIGHQEFKNSELGLVPKAWKIVRLKEVLSEAQYGLSMPMKAKGEYPILRMAAIQNGDIGMSDLKYVDLKPDAANAYLLQKGDVLFNRTNSFEHVGKVGIFRHEQPAVFASYLIRLKPNEDMVDSFFLGHMLNTYAVQCRIRRFATPGVQQVNINATNLKSVYVALPVGPEGRKEQELIVAVMECQFQAIKHLEERIATLRRLKSGLMQDLLTGKVRVPATLEVAGA